MMFFISCSQNTNSNCNNLCSNLEKCVDEECILIEGVCQNNTECQQSEICDLNTNQCVNNPCQAWEEYTAGACVLRVNACNVNADCQATETCIDHKCSTAPASCNGINCSNHGVCQINVNVAICNCNLGYQDNDDNLTCEPDCSTVNNCGANALSCNDSTGLAVCTCQNNYYANNQYNCISPCDTVTCNNGVCVADGVTESHCQCNAGYHDYNNECFADPIKVSVGNYFTCSLLSDKKIICFGENSLGQLGNETNVSSFNLTTVKIIDNAIDIVSGAKHSCALLDNNKVKCWGDNQFGQLGNGNFIKSNTPVDTLDLENVVSLKAGSFHNCALLSDGKVKCWGMNLYAQLGNRELTNRNEPVFVVKDFLFNPIEDVAFIDAGGLHNCLQQNTGDIHCFGANGNGQLGIDKDWNDYSSCRNSSCKDAREIQSKDKTNITFLSERDEDRATFSAVDKLILGGNYTCALKGTDFYAWGENSFNQLSITQLNNQLVPTETPLLTGYDNIKAGGSQTCGTKANKLYCWGRNMFGELGNIEKTNIPVEIPNLTNITEYSLGINHNCAIEGVKIKCWGSNIRGELGVDTENTENSSTPVETLGF